jgi:hypothetical protein
MSRLIQYRQIGGAQILTIPLLQYLQQERVGVVEMLTAESGYGGSVPGNSPVHGKKKQFRDDGQTSRDVIFESCVADRRNRPSKAMCSIF